MVSMSGAFHFWYCLAKADSIDMMQMISFCDEHDIHIISGNTINHEMCSVSQKQDSFLVLYALMQDLLQHCYCHIFTILYPS